MRKLALAFVVLQSAVWPGSAQPAADAAAEVKLEVRTRGGQTTFHLGEVIPLELAFTSSVEKKYQLDMASYDRSGRLNEERFTVTPLSGWVDPLDLYFRAQSGFFGGGLRGIQILSAKPVMVYEELNEWVRFDQPGEYRVVVSSARASSVERMIGNGPRVLSNELLLTLVAATPEWQQEELQRALDVLNGPAAARPPRAGELDAHHDAVKSLRYLGTAAAAREMAHRLPDWDCRLGLAGSPTRDAGLDEMKKILRDPKVPVDTGFLDLMSVLALPEGRGQRWTERDQLENTFRQELIAVLPLKQGPALAVSAKTVLESNRTLPAELKQSLAKALIANFDNLSAGEQFSLIESHSKDFDRAAWLPLLRKVAQRYQDFPHMREMNSFMFNQASASALRQWYAMAPEEARPAVFQEITRPEPRFGNTVLGMLPDKELPAETKSLVQHLKTSQNADALVNLASLIYRYADASAEPEVISYLDPRLGKWGCDLQEPLLAWLLKVDPESARPRLETVLASRKNTGCYTTLLAEVGKLQPGPVLQELALKALNDPNSQVLASAASYLASYGTAAAQDALWARFTAWSQRWAGHESELRYIPGESLDRTWEAGAGQNMLQALGGGQGWIASEDQLRRLIALSVGPAQRQQAESFLKVWQSPWDIQFAGMGQFQIAQYRAMSLDLAKAKLLQFPKGSEFRLIVSRQDRESDAYRQLSSFAKENGLVIKENPPK